MQFSFLKILFTTRIFDGFQCNTLYKLKLLNKEYLGKREICSLLKGKNAQISRCWRFLKMSAKKRYPLLGRVCYEGFTAFNQTQLL